MSVNYRMSFIAGIDKALEKNPTMRLGEILYSIVRKQNMNGLHFFYAEDNEMISALEKFNSFVEELDEPMSQEDFEKWLSNY